MTVAAREKPKWIHLRNVDLDLLIAFDALMKTRHLTRAGQTLGIGQPGVSATLARLRQTYGDERFVKQRGGIWVARSTPMGTLTKLHSLTFRR
jgi:hypothetical protein